MGSAFAWVATPLSRLAMTWQRRVSVSSDRTCKVHRRASDFNVLGAKFCNFVTPRADLAPSRATGFVHSRGEARQERTAEAVTPRFLQAEPKPVQTGPRKRAWIFLDFFVRFGAFQWVASSPSQKSNFRRLENLAPAGRDRRGPRRAKAQARRRALSIAGALSLRRRSAALLPVDCPLRRRAPGKPGLVRTTRAPPRTPHPPLPSIGSVWRRGSLSGDCSLAHWGLLV